MSMGVYIKDMEMPTNCHSCPMCLMRFCQAGDRELSERETRPNAKRPEDCPLLPVPPHGNLIDRDKLEKDIDEYIGGEESRSRFHHWVQVQSVVIPGNKGEQT